MIGTSIKTDKTKRGREHIMRESGILMPVSSLPGPYGIGCFGKKAEKFVDFLAAAGLPENNNRREKTDSSIQRAKCADSPHTYRIQHTGQKQDEGGFRRIIQQT